MAPNPLARPASSAWCLTAARTLAWALWLGGWLVLGSWGRQLWPHAAGGLAAPALWLVVLAAAVSQRAWPPRWQAGWALGTAAAAALAASRLNSPDAGTALALLVLAWGGLMVTAATVVQGLRASTTGRDRRPSPVTPALLGAISAWAVAGDAVALLTQPMRLAGALALVGMGLAWLACRHPAKHPPAAPCPRGLFDGAWPAPHRPGAAIVAQLAMLPMMASLPWMADWCAGAGIGAAQQVALHLAAMLLPAWACSTSTTPASTGRPPCEAMTRACAGLLAAGGLALLAPGGLAGLGLAGLAHGAAWSLAWHQRLGTRRTALAVGARAVVGSEAARSTLPKPTRTLGLLAAATAVLALGAAIAALGPLALQLVHGALAVAGVLTVLSQGWRRLHHTLTRSRPA